jgi:hypothetical protein
MVNVVNVGERYKNVTFITYPHESKGLVNVVNVAPGYFHCGAREMPNAGARRATESRRISKLISKKL